MQYYETEEALTYLLRAPYGILEFDKPRLQELIDIIADPESSLIFIRSQSFDKEVDKEDEWFKTKYSKAKYSEELLKIMKNPSSPQGKKKLDIPPHNNLLPKNLDVLSPQPDLSKQPILVQVWDDADLWYQKDDKFLRPKAVIDMKLYTNDCSFGRTPQGRVFVDVFNECLKETLREFFYMASQAELEATISAYHDNINFKWKGYSDSLPTFVDETLKRIRAFNPADNEDIFN